MVLRGRAGPSGVGPALLHVYVREIHPRPRLAKPATARPPPRSYSNRDREPLCARPSARRARSGSAPRPARVARSRSAVLHPDPHASRRGTRDRGLEWIALATSGTRDPFLREGPMTRRCRKIFWENFLCGATRTNAQLARFALVAISVHLGHTGSRWAPHHRPSGGPGSRLAGPAGAQGGRCWPDPIGPEGSRCLRDGDWMKDGVAPVG